MRSERSEVKDFSGTALASFYGRKAETVGFTKRQEPVFPFHQTPDESERAEVRGWPSPSPRPSRTGRGRIVRPYLGGSKRLDYSRAGMRISLSLGVRGKEPLQHQCAPGLASPTGATLAQSSIDLDEPYALCGRSAFTLLEVLVAMAVFFIVVFAILGIVVQSLGAARALQRPQPDFSILASQVVLSNILDEGCESGDFGDLGAEYEDYVWERCCTEVGSNNLKQVDFVVTKSDSRGKEVAETMSILVVKPGSRKTL